MKVPTTATPPDEILTAEQRRNYIWWFHDFDVNCDGTLDKEEHRRWARSLEASVGLLASSATASAFPIPYSSFLSLAVLLEGTDSFFARKLSALLELCPDQMAACQQNCECVRDVASARTGTMDSTIARKFLDAERAARVIKTAAKLSLTLV